MSANVEILRPVVAGRPSDFGYPASSYFEVLQSPNLTIHRIVYSAAPAALFNNAPNGSECYDATNYKLWRKSGTLGKADGTWYGIQLA